MKATKQELAALASVANKLEDERNGPAETTIYALEYRKESGQWDLVGDANTPALMVMGDYGLAKRLNKSVAPGYRWFDVSDRAKHLRRKKKAHS